MKNKIFLLCIICFFTACSKNQKLTAKENTIVTKNEIISNEDFGELEKLKPLLEIKIGTERNQVKEILNGYSLNEEDEDSISYKLFKIYDDLETGEDDIELELFCDFDENNLLKNFDLSMEHTILTEVEAKITYDNYNKLKRFISKYYKTPAASFEQGEVDKLKVPTIDLWQTKNEKVLLSILTMDMFGYQFTVYMICKKGI